MNTKRLTGLAVMIMGIITLGFALHSRYKVEEAERTVTGASKYLSEHPVWQVIGGVLQAKVEQYDSLLQFVLICGLILVIIGVLVAIFSRSKQH